VEPDQHDVDSNSDSGGSVANEPIFSRAKNGPYPKNPPPDEGGKKEDGGDVDQHREKDGEEGNSDSVEDEPIFARARPKNRKEPRGEVGKFERGPIKTFQDHVEEKRIQDAGVKHGPNIAGGKDHKDVESEGSNPSSPIFTRRKAEKVAGPGAKPCSLRLMTWILGVG
jgi:hypothetical protein